MGSPLVSICLPNLNTRAFLEERIDSLLNQTYQNWEIVISDNYSDDGAWELFVSLASSDSRVSIEQAPRRGMYQNWNNCLRRARGEYVYIATSDDTMAHDCLEKMVAALEHHTDCDLAHCPLVFIDERSNPSPDRIWPDCTVFAEGLGELARRPHVRRAPYDGLIHLTGKHVVLSITQLLIRRSLFDRIGDFPSRWGSIGDFNWEMKAGLVANMVHVPDTWASWRLHPGQATAAVVFGAEVDRKREEMIDDALAACKSLMPPMLGHGIESRWVEPTRDLTTYYEGLRARRESFMGRRLYQLKEFIAGSRATRKEIARRLLGKPKWSGLEPPEIRTWLAGLTGRPPIESTPGPAVGDGAKALASSNGLQSHW